MTTHFNYWLTGYGWAELYFSCDNQKIKFDVSYLSDPLADLFAGMSRLMNSESANEKISFFDEPGEHSLIIEKLDNEAIRIQIFWDSNQDGASEADPGQNKAELVYSDTDTLKNLAMIICAGIDSLLVRHTLVEYEELWISYEFPFDKYEQLKRLSN